MLWKINIVFVLCLAVTVLAAGHGERARYDNYHLYKAVASNVQELAILKDLESASDSIIILNGVHSVDHDVHVVVAPHKVPDFLELMSMHEIEYQLVERNFQSIIGEPKEKKKRRSPADYYWEDYSDLEDTYIWLQHLASNFSGVVTTIEAGKTYERRSILGVKISARDNKKNKPGIFVEGGIHAREWISPATVTYIIEQLLRSTDPQIKELFDNYVWYIFPHANPDGYEYTHTTNRLWRKTRKPYDTCFGADPNRNWDYHWNEVGTSSNPCAENYAGPQAFSEIETRSMANYITSIKDKIRLYLSFHSYSQLLLHPYGHTSELPENGKDYEQVVAAALAAVQTRYDTQYTGGSTYNAIYPAAGTSIDWVYGVANIPMSFTYELRPNSSTSGGFVLPPEQIIPTAEETLDSVVALINEMKKLGYFD